MRFSDTPACAGIDTEIFFTEEKGNYTNLDFIKKCATLAQYESNALTMQ
jgi:hypothetical protein